VLISGRFSSTSTSTSTVRQGGLSTSTRSGFWGDVCCLFRARARARACARFELELRVGAAVRQGAVFGLASRGRCRGFGCWLPALCVLKGVARAMRVLWRPLGLTRSREGAKGIAWGAFEPPRGCG
jgi:hypothetical protein